MQEQQPSGRLPGEARKKSSAEALAQTFFGVIEDPATIRRGIRRSLLGAAQDLLAGPAAPQSERASGLYLAHTQRFLKP